MDYICIYIYGKWKTEQRAFEQNQKKKGTDTKPTLIFP